MGTLTRIIPVESTVTASSPAQLFVHGPVTEDAHSTVATLPGARLLHTNTPLPLKEVITGAAACAARPVQSAKAPRLSFITVARFFMLLLPFTICEGRRDYFWSSRWSAAYSAAERGQAGTKEKCILLHSPGGKGAMGVSSSELHR